MKRVAYMTNYSRPAMTIHDWLRGLSTRINEQEVHSVLEDSLFLDGVLWVKGYGQNGKSEWVEAYWYFSEEIQPPLISVRHEYE